jgi:hypothetical protein
MRSSLRSLSLWSCFILLAVSLVIRFSYFTNDSKNGYNATTWDALGYYMYLPGYLIYDDVTELNWFPAIDSTYNVSGGNLYQATQLEKGGYAFKYLGGVAIMELPFFYGGHAVACMTDAPEDGFSWPYQYAVLFGAIFWFFIGCLILRKVLRRYYSETITTLTLLLIGLASNLLQYVSVDGAMSHVFIFPLYAAMLWLTIRWHEQPKARTALLMGFVAGLAIICRPTELIIVFIPILWSLEGSGKLKSKWKLVRAHRSHVFWAAGGGIIGILPQLLYWKQATGSWVYDVGSKWLFFNPWWRVLFGFEKGWFIYTPIAVFMVIGLFCLKGKPFRRSVLTFCLLNIWIIIAWSDWRYGASYSTRALTQSYPVFALALAAFLERTYVYGKRWLILGGGAYLIFVNLFQIGQYNALVLHFDQMNRPYYAAIYLDRNPTPLDYSLLDSQEQPCLDFVQKPILKGFFQGGAIHATVGAPQFLGGIRIHSEHWLKTGWKINATKGLLTGQLVLTCFEHQKPVKEKRFRLATPRSKDGMDVSYENFVELPAGIDSVAIRVDTFDQLDARMKKGVFVTY